MATKDNEEFKSIIHTMPLVPDELTEIEKTIPVEFVKLFTTDGDEKKVGINQYPNDDKADCLLMKRWQNEWKLDDVIMRMQEMQMFFDDRLNVYNKIFDTSNVAYVKAHAAYFTKLLRFRIANDDQVRKDIVDEGFHYFDVVKYFENNFKVSDSQMQRDLLKAALHLAVLRAQAQMNHGPGFQEIHEPIVWLYAVLSKEGKK